MIKTLKSKRIKEVLKEGKVLKAKNFMFLYLPSNDENLKFAFIVSKKVSKKAVKRNRVKRILKEALRLLLKENENWLTNPFDIVIIGNKTLLKKKVVKLQLN